MSGFLPGQLLRAQQLNEAIDNGGIVRSVAGRTGNVTLSSDDVLGAAPIASPLFTGEPRAHRRADLPGGHRECPDRRQHVYAGEGVVR